MDAPGVERTENATVRSPGISPAPLIKTIILTAGVVGLLNLTASRADADSSWVTSGTGSWTDSGNWTPELPSSDINAIINQGTSVVMGGDLAEAPMLTVATSGTGALVIESGGNASTQYGFIGNNTDSNGSVTVSGTWDNMFYINVGNYGSGTLEIASGGKVTDETGFIGANLGSTGSATVSGTWENTSTIYVGNYGNGSLTIESGGVRFRCHRLYRATGGLYRNSFREWLVDQYVRSLCGEFRYGDVGNRERRVCFKRRRISGIRGRFRRHRDREWNME